MVPSGARAVGRYLGSAERQQAGSRWRPVAVRSLMNCHEVERPRNDAVTIQSRNPPQPFGGQHFSEPAG